MTEPRPATTEARGFLAPAAQGHPVSHCVRCGKETPAGVALCDADNPGRIKAPSATQLHATILVGVVLGVAGLLFLLRLAVAPGGPYVATVIGTASNEDGGLTVSVQVRNSGTAAGVATCHITRDGSSRPDDLTFRTDRLVPGASVTVTREVAAPTDKQPAFVVDRVSTVCA